ncbi:hypothetical protein PM8797T_09054 [Gimesia maris DSM 8797]|nr:hypothetical protein PM8797T_09054 [Gimesia maris DSM 8797]
MCCLFSAVSAVAEEPQPITIDIKEFSELKPAEQKALILKAFARRLEHAKNLYYEVDLTGLIYENKNEQPGKLRTKTPFRRCRHWLLEDSYRIDSDMFRPDEEEANQWVSDSYDAQQRITRGTIINKTHSFGRIDRVHDRVISDNHYIYWLRGEYPDKSEYLFQDMIDRKASFEIRAPVDSGKVQLTVKYQPYWTNKPYGSRKMILDPERGFLPIRGESRWREFPGLERKPSYRIERFTVSKSKLVEDVWMPVEIREDTMTSSLPQSISTLEIKITRIEQGKVKPADLVVPFSDGMMIVDTIKGVSYVSDDAGKPTGPVEPLYYGPPPVAPKKKSNEPQ